jgi:glyoxylase-like metal-dependent hydrolase (beta-lactamase superfamily II)
VSAGVGVGGVEAGVTEADLAELGVHRIPMPVPFPQAGGAVNAYLVEERDGRVLLVDAGLDTPEAHAALEAGFARLGRRLDEVSRILLTHGHIDHYGAARFVQERGSGAPVYAHPADVAKVAESGWRWREQVPLFVAHLARLGVPADAIAAQTREGERGFGLARRVAEVRPLEPGTVVETRALRLEVLHMPGHTPGLVCLYDRARRLLFSGDHLLERISPNPLIELGPDGRDGYFRPLLAYLDSLRRTRALDVDLVLPGHGRPFGGHRAVIDALLGFVEKRQARIRDVLRDGPHTAYEVSRALFPVARPGDGFLVVSETIGNLEVLEARGDVVREEAAGIFRHRLAG